MRRTCRERFRHRSTVYCAYESSRRKLCSLCDPVFTPDQRFIDSAGARSHGSKNRVWPGRRGISKNWAARTRT
ncbi:MAG: hypothetical protein HOP29_13505 [Phycisphaerales bacterium]|nr:hypothetical protein [Phycisphaerales bacterium]